MLCTGSYFLKVVRCAKTSMRSWLLVVHAMFESHVYGVSSIASFYYVRIGMIRKFRLSYKVALFP